MYVDSLKKVDKNDEASKHGEMLQRFVSHCSSQTKPVRQMSDMDSKVVSGYASSFTGTGTDPQAAERIQAVRRFLSFALKQKLTNESLARHARIPRARSRRGPGVTQQEERIQLTSEGYENLLSEMEALIARRPQISADIQRAAADKDVRENAPLEAAREEQGRVEARIREIEQTLSVAVVIDSAEQGRYLTVQLGATVEIKDVGRGRMSKYMVVSASEANPLEGKISDVSPLGKALLNGMRGREVSVETPRGMKKYQIVEIT